MASEWTAPLYSKSRVDAAGRDLVDPSASAADRELALAVTNNWRSSHSFPLNTFQMTLRTRARQIDDDALVAQRIKRLPSIEAKLRRFPKMGLARMQDIGGCRAVVTDVRAVDALSNMYRASRFKHTKVRDDDYLRNPKPSGYRGVHLAYRYYSDKKTTYNGLKIEVQIRSRVEHAWATAVETVGMFSGQALKASHGDDKWLRFFSLAASEMAFMEQLPPVPGTPSTRREVRAELQDLAAALDVLERLRNYQEALRVLDEHEPLQGAGYYLLELDAAESLLRLRAYPRGSGSLERASDAYAAIERATADDPRHDVVLVSAESVSSLRRAYPNYFLDTTEFLRIVRRALKSN